MAEGREMGCVFPGIWFVSKQRFDVSSLTLYFPLCREIQSGLWNFWPQITEQLSQPPRLPKFMKEGIRSSVKHSCSKSLSPKSLLVQLLLLECRELDFPFNKVSICFPRREDVWSVCGFKNLWPPSRTHNYTFFFEFISP